MRSLVFIVLGICLIIVSTFAKNTTVEKWSSFLFGLSLPLFVGGIISIVNHLRQSKQGKAANN
jgi:ABC-type dipeptide/oligopeptide/nickel transport system permease component